MHHSRGQADLDRGVSPEEIARFDALAARWWDPDGPMKPLHRMNPLRIGWINHRIPPASRVLDVGCGAGLAAEALARLGHDVLGIDAAGEALAAARAHAEGEGLKLAYRDAVAGDLVTEGARFPVISALEVIEHVPRPGGLPGHAGGAAGAGRGDFSVHAQPHAAQLSHRQAGGGICHALAAGGHA